MAKIDFVGPVNNQSNLFQVNLYLLHVPVSIYLFKDICGQFLNIMVQ